LQPGGRVHHITESERLALFVAGADRHDSLARGHRGPGAELPAGLGSIHLLHGLQGPQAGPNGALGIVGMGDRSAEHGHDGVPDELLHSPAEPLDLVLDPVVVQLQEVANIFRIRSIRSRGESDQIDEQDRHNLALFPGFRRTVELRSARQAEPGSLGVSLAALPTGRHSQKATVRPSSSTRAWAATGYLGTRFAPSAESGP
jgi:hypothetical protein